MNKFFNIERLEIARKCQTELVEKTRKAKNLYRAGKITILELYRSASIERLAQRIDFSGIMNVTKSGDIESGKLISIDGNYDYKCTINYCGNATIKIYKTRYYLFDGSNIVVRMAWQRYDWDWDKITKLFDVELINILLDNLKAGKRREFVRFIKFLLNTRYTGLKFKDIVD
jgi:hypothetical protein